MTKSKLVAMLCSVVLVGCGGTSQDPSSLETQTKQAVRSNKAVGSTPADYEQVTQALYVAFFGRPADPGGLANYEAALLAAAAPTDINGLAGAYKTNITVKALIDSFGTSSESLALYGTGTTTQFVDAIYQNVLGRAPESAGQTFWVNAISSGQLTQGNAALSIMAGAETNTTTQGLFDAQLVNNRLTAAEYFTTQVAYEGATSDYAGAPAAWNARSMLSQVTATTNTTGFQSNEESTITLIVEETAAFNEFNSFRVSQGVGALKQNLSLYEGAAAHANYLKLNGTGGGHVETAGLPGYVAEDIGGRAEAYGYPYYNVGEVIGYVGISNGNLSGQGSATVDGLIDTVYHRAGMMYQYVTDVGVGINAGGNGTYSIDVIDMGWLNSSITPTTFDGVVILPEPTTVSGSYFGVYPLPSQTGVALSMSPETPSPFPNLTPDQFATNTGYPISVTGPSNSALTITSFTVAPTGSTTALASKLFTSSDPELVAYPNLAFIVPTAPLLANTSYTVTFVGTSNGNQISKTWSFTTSN